MAHSSYLCYVLDIKSSLIRRRRTRDPRRGNAMVEFSLVFLLFLGFVLSFVQLGYTVWAKTTLHYAARLGARYAITGQTLAGMAHDASIREVIRRNSVGLLPAATIDTAVEINYYDGLGAASTENASGNVVEIVVTKDVDLLTVSLPFLFSQAAPSSDPFTLTVVSADRMEPITNPPPRI